MVLMMSLHLFHSDFPDRTDRHRVALSRFHHKLDQITVDETLMIPMGILGHHSRRDKDIDNTRTERVLHITRPNVLNIMQQFNENSTFDHVFYALGPGIVEKALRTKSP